MSRITGFFNKISEKGGFFMFIRSQLSSQMATWVDNIIAFTLKKGLDIFKIKVVYFFSRGIESYMLATIVGQICGGIISCIFNHRWAFKTNNIIKFRYILIKFFMVWLISLSLNAYLIFVLTEYFKHRTIIRDIFGYANSDDIFIIIKLLVSLVVGFGWNYSMYRVFVFRNVDYKKFFHKIYENTIHNPDSKNKKDKLDDQN